MFVPGDRILESQSEVESVAFSKNGALLAAGCRDGKIRVWNLASGALERTVEAKGANLLAAHGHFSTVGADGSQHCGNFSCTRADMAADELVVLFQG